MAAIASNCSAIRIHRKVICAASSVSNCASCFDHPSRKGAPTKNCDSKWPQDASARWDPHRNCCPSPAHIEGCTMRRQMQWTRVGGEYSANNRIRQWRSLPIPQEWSGVYQILQVSSFLTLPSSVKMNHVRLFTFPETTKMQASTWRSILAVVWRAFPEPSSASLRTATLELFVDFAAQRTIPRDAVIWSRGQTASTRTRIVWANATQSLSISST